MACTMRICNSYHKIRFIEREIVVTAVPENNITACGILFCFTEYRFIIDTCIDNITPYNMWFIFLHLFNGAFIFFKITNFSKTLYLLFIQVTIRHRMPDGNYFYALAHEQFNHLPRRLAFTATCSYSSNCYDRFAALQHGIRRSEKHKVCSCSIYYCTYRHHFLIWNITIGKDTVINIIFPDQIGKIRFSKNRYSFGIKTPRQLLWVFPTINIWNLCRGESNNIIQFIISETGIEIVKITTCCTNDDDILF